MLAIYCIVFYLLSTRTVSKSVLSHNMAENLDDCISSLKSEGQPTFPTNTKGTLWCNATWDTFMCWPAIPANSSYTLPCPPLRGLDSNATVVKYCHESGRWAGKNSSDFSSFHGYTDYLTCMVFPNLTEMVQKMLTNEAVIEMIEAVSL